MESSGTRWQGTHRLLDWDHIIGNPSVRKPCCVIGHKWKLYPSTPDRLAYAAGAAGIESERRCGLRPDPSGDRPMECEVQTTGLRRLLESQSEIRLRGGAKQLAAPASPESPAL